MKTISRRQFIQGSTAAFVLSTLGSFPLVAEEDLWNPLSSKDRILVVIQLMGGNDGLSTVIPAGNPLYAENRRILQIHENEVLPLDREVGFHPALEGLHKLFKNGQMTVLQGVGYPTPDRSHFRSTEIWDTAKSDVIDTRSGWIGRCADLWARQGHQKFMACSIGNQEQPLSLVGMQAVPPTIRDAQSFRILKESEETQESTQRLQLLQNLAEVPRTSENLEFVRQQTQSSLTSALSVEAIVQQGATDLGGSELAQKLGVVSAMIQGGLATRIYHVSMGGFDTHSNQKNDHTALLRQLDQSISAFFEKMKEAKLEKQIAILVYSEFGRRVRENRSGGTDHGAAAPVFVISGAMRGGVVGSHPPLDDLDDGDLKMKTDFRSIYQTLIEGWLNLQSVPILGKTYSRVPLFG